QLDQMLQAVLEKLIDAFEVKGGAVYLAQDDTAVFQLSASADTSGSGTYPAQLMPGTRHPQALAAELDDPGQYLCIPMKDHKSALLGVLVLQLTPEQRNADQASLAFTRFVHALSGAAAVAIETRQLIDAQQHLLEAIIQLLANAIDAKSPYTGGHCERVPLLAESLIHQVIHADQGPYADFSMSDTELYEFRVAAWMHDCGKIASPESVM